MIIAIDLGTSNSLVGVWQDGRHVLIPNSLGKMLTPSAVSLLDSGEVVVGEAARDRLLTHPASSAGGFKRFMGSDRPILLDRRPFRAEELSALVLGALKADAEAWLGARVSEAVITVPAYFNDLQRQATRAAGQLAGLKVERLLNEPTAAALAYGLAQFSDQGHDQARILVVDLGGGTFDVSILELFDGVMEVRATAGDNFLGGEDFVDAIVDAFHAAVGRAAGLPARGEADTHPAYVALRRQAELAKRSLSDHQAATLNINLNQQTLTWSLTQEQFVDISEPLLQRLRRPLAQAVKDARLDPAELTQIVLAGGATRMPAVRKMIARMFGRLPAQTINPDEVVARGAAVQAGLKMRDAALEEVVMTDVAPFSLGIETSRIDANEVRQFGLFAPILERNTVIPASRVQRFFTIRDNQTKIDIEIFQGEARKVSDNIRLGKMSLVVPRAPAGQESVDVRFTYDVSGMLEVEVTVTSTGEVVSTLIEGSAQALSAAEIAARRERLAALKIHPRDQAENRAALSRAERLFEECLGTTRARVGAWVDDFVAALDSQDGKRIDLARRTLLQHLAEIDRDPFEG